MYDNWLFFHHFLSPPKKKSVEEKENEFAKPVLNKFFSDPFDFHHKQTIKSMNLAYQ